MLLKFLIICLMVYTYIAIYGSYKTDYDSINEADIIWKSTPTIKLYKETWADWEVIE
jgi:hypothetical protein